MTTATAPRICADCGDKVPEGEFWSEGWSLCSLCYRDEVNAGEVYEDREGDEEEDDA